MKCNNRLLILTFLYLHKLNQTFSSQIMALYFLRKKLQQDANLVAKIPTELTLIGDKIVIHFFKRLGDKLAVPYYFGKMMLKYGDLAFAEALELEKIEMKKEEENNNSTHSQSHSSNSFSPLLNLRKSHQSITLRRNYELRENQVEALGEAIGALQ